MDCHERQILRLEPRGTYYSRGCKWLLSKGLLIFKPFLKDGRTMFGFFITPKGIDYLKDIGEDEQNLALEHGKGDKVQSRILAGVNG